MKKSLVFVVLPLILVLTIAISCAPAPSTPAGASPAPAASAKPAAATAQFKPVELKFDIYTPPGNPIVRVAESFYAPEVERRTNGRIKLKIYPAEALGPAATTVDRVETGAVDMGQVMFPYSPGRFPLLDVVNLPFLSPDNVTSAVTLSRLNDEGWFDKELGNIVLLWPRSVMTYHFFFTKKKVTSLDEMKGLKIRGPGGILDKAISLLGAVPIQTTAPEMYTAAATGVVDGISHAEYALQSYRLMEIVKYHLDISYASAANAAFCINRKLFESFPKDIQDILKGMAVEGALATGITAAKDDSAALAEANGKYRMESYRLSSDELKRWKQALNPIYVQYIDSLNKKGLPAKAFLDRLKQIVASYGLELPFTP